jgi:hypothetical protein
MTEQNNICKCCVCTLRLFGQCPTKIDLVMKKLEKDKETHKDRNKDINFFKAMWMEFATDDKKYNNK